MKPKKRRRLLHVACACLCLLNAFSVFGWSRRRTSAVQTIARVGSWRTASAFYDTRRQHCPEDTRCPHLLKRVVILADAATKDVAAALQSVFHRVGAACQVVLRNERALVDSASLVVALTCARPPITATLAVYQLGQLSADGYGSDGCTDAWSHADYILEASPLNYAFYPGDDKHKLIHLPVPFVLAFNHRHDAVANPACQAVTYGVHSARQATIVDALRQRHRFNICTAVDATRDAHPRIVLNIHAHDRAVMDTRSIHRALQSDSLVISEPPSAGDARTRRLYDDVVVFCDSLEDVDRQVDRVDTMAAFIARFQQPDAYTDYIVQRRPRLAHLEQFTFAKFQNALASMGVEPQALLPRRLHPDDIHYISLDDSFASTRVQTFLAQPDAPLHRLRHVSAITAHPAWVGCGLTYQSLLYSAQASRADRVTICEDDVVMAPGFEERYNVVLDYLDGHAENWNIFVGLISDLDDATHVLNVYEHQGVTFVHLNSFSSTVFNVYHNSVYDTVMRWNSTHACSADQQKQGRPFKYCDHASARDVTVDRYLSKQNLTIVTTYPFLVGHMDLDSSLWGQHQPDYKTMVRASQSLLKSKIDAFQSGNRFVL